MQSAHRAKFVVSSKRDPCPVCDRTKDGDCRFMECGNVVLCHTQVSGRQGDRQGDYVYQRESKDGLWGVWVYQKEGKNGKISGRKPIRKENREKFFYRDRSGNNLVAVERCPKPDGGKDFYQYHFDGRNWVPGMPDSVRPTVPIYRYQEVQEAIARKEPIFLVEGEGKCDALWSIGIAATTTLGGSKKYRNYGTGYQSDLKDADLVLCPDRDKVGIEHMEDISRDFPNAGWCRVFPKSPIWQALPDNHGLDVGDWIEFGASKEEILASIDRKAGESTNSPKTLESLKQAVAQFSEIKDPFERAIAENTIGEAFKVRGARLERLVNHHEAQKSRLEVQAASEIAYGLLEQIEERSRTGIHSGLFSNLKALDAMTTGFQRGDLIVVAGRTSMGKSAFAGHLLANMAEIYGDPGLLFSMEMDKQKIITRLISMECKIPSGRLISGHIADREWNLLADAIAKVAALPIFIDDSPSPSIQDIEEKAKTLKDQHGQLSGVFVDHLQFLDYGGEFLAQEIAKVTKRLKVLARELDCPVFALSQINRGVEGRDNKRPTSSDLKSSGGIEQDADLILMLYRDEYYRPDSCDRGIAEIIITKNRNGPTGTVKVLFDPEYTRFADGVFGDN